MSRVHAYKRMRLCLFPTVKHAAAWKDKRVLPVGVDHRQFQITIKRRG